MVTAWNSSGEDHAPEAGGIGRIIGRENLLEDAGLDLLVRSRTEGLGDVEGDFARGQCLEHDGRKRREAQTALDEADGQTEAAGNIFDRPLRRGPSDRKSARLNSSHYCASRMPSSAWNQKHS